MPPQTSRTSLVAKYGGRLQKAFDAHKEDETEYSAFSSLPPGITNGVAQLRKCEFGVYKTGDMTGEWYFMAQGIVVTPKSHGGVTTEGKFTKIGPEPLCDTPKRSRKTTDDHVAWVLNEMRKLGLDTSNMSVQNLEAGAALLAEEQPHFNFNTRAGTPTEQYPDPRTFEEWTGTCDEPLPDEEDADTQDDSEALAEEEPEPAPPPRRTVAPKPPAAPAAKNGRATPAVPPRKPAPTPAAKAPPPTGKRPAAKPTPVPEPEPEPAAQSFDEFGDLDSLAAKADRGDKKAAKELQDLAVGAGVDEEAIATAGSWVEVVAMFGTAPAADGAEAESDTEAEDGAEEEAAEAEAEPDVEEEPQPVVPKKGNVYFYTPPKATKPVECSVTAVLKGELVNLKNLDSNVEYAKVPWAKLRELD